MSKFVIVFIAQLLVVKSAGPEYDQWCKKLAHREKNLTKACPKFKSCCVTECSKYPNNASRGYALKCEAKAKGPKFDVIYMDGSTCGCGMRHRP
uniref:Uncharacterized protein n=1 Tax=Romanomermis culicivorax TaxID=13658 RepID=A0A915L898_ROMCU